MVTPNGPNFEQCLIKPYTMKLDPGLPISKAYEQVASEEPTRQHRPYREGIRVDSGLWCDIRAQVLRGFVVGGGFGFLRT